MMNRHFSVRVAVAALLVSLGAPTLAAASADEPEGIVSLAASASVQVPNDWITVDFSTTRDGPDAAAVQAALKGALASALALAQRVARPDGHVDVEGGGFSLQPQFDAKGRVGGWSGSTEMRVRGRDMQAIAELAGQVSTMTVSSLAYGVSRETRERVEGDAAAQAIARFRAKADDYAKAFGYRGYVVREVNVQTDAGSVSPPRPMMMMNKRASLAVGEALPVQAGSGAVTSNVAGSVQMK